MLHITNVPSHIAIIPDGNRRWSAKENKKKWDGYVAGVNNLERAIDWCIEAGVKTVSVYAISLENLKARNRTQIREIFDVMYMFIEKLLRPNSIIDKYEINVNFKGDMRRVPTRLIRLIRRLTEKTANYGKRVFNILIAYSGHEELVNAFRNILTKFEKNIKIKITPKLIQRELYINKPVDLVIRTGGVNRLSNFLLWQSAYAEIYTTKTLWPDFSKREFVKALTWFSNTQRNFGR